MRKSKILITGGCGFIGTNFIHFLFNNPSFQGEVINLDKLTYAGNRNNLKTIEAEFLNKRYFFEQTDICDLVQLEKIYHKYEPDIIVHFAAESHVDRSIHEPAAFINTNIIGTFNLLELTRKLSEQGRDILFHHVSTDEVFGSLGDEGCFVETSPYDPRSPYSASKASSDHLVRAYFHTYKLPITISNCSNNYGPFQFPEKLIPLMISNMLQNKPLPIYGDGKNVRDWLFVEDHCSGIWEIISHGNIGETYNLGGENELTNMELVNILCEKMALLKNESIDHYKKLIAYVKDRPGHDRRYAIDCSKIKQELNWKQAVTFEKGLEKTIFWYLDNLEWIKQIKSGAYKNWINKNYSDR
ncbi:MAG: dTDP-glucose 4,6-dehydratase [Candidatus Cloacimonetes bacterium]|nr:dTDP-glucose 4,6-dehydratase [Candidatus Cloacimonadota bacterium]MCF7884804.1 dTDP-glucose 4,6-dehydratase [Candidatus Cloacimonadota bacterium]